MRRWLSRLAPVTALVAGACVASKQDIRLLQNDLAVMRAEQAQADSARRLALDSIATTLRMASDSLRQLSNRMGRFQGDVAGSLYSMQQQLITVQELTGQSQARLQELRASVEQHTAPAPAATDSTAGGPGPNQLFQIALDQLRRGSSTSARTAFQDLLTRYPTADIAPDAQYYVAESYAAERKGPEADSAYVLVVQRYPNSTRAPTALYKHAIALRDAGRSALAREAFNEVIRRYPRSDEAVLARGQLQNLK